MLQSRRLHLFPPITVSQYFYFFFFLISILRFFIYLGTYSLLSSAHSRTRYFVVVTVTDTSLIGIRTVIHTRFGKGIGILCVSNFTLYITYIVLFNYLILVTSNALGLRSHARYTYVRTLCCVIENRRFALHVYRKYIDISATIVFCTDSTNDLAFLEKRWGIISISAVRQLIQSIS